ncbi:MAG: rhodanese-like domain-containing protein [bacterium]
MSTKQTLVALGVTVAMVGIGLWLFDNHAAQGKDVPAGALVVDVRTPGEFSSGHYDGAVNIPLSQLRGRQGELGGKDRHIIVYCRSGSRSSYAKRFLDQAGFTRVEDGGGLSQMRRRKRASKSAQPGAAAP